MKHHVEFDIEFLENQYPGKFIALEGIDGSGKSTQIQELKKALEKKGRSVVVKHPFEGEIGKFVRTILIGKVKVPPVALQYLIAANRDVQQKEIIEALQNNHDVIIDRYFWSAVTYGMFDLADDSTEQTSNWLLTAYSLLSMYHRFLLPNTTFFLQISAGAAIERIDAMNKEREIYEDEEKIKKINELYQLLIRKFPEQFTIINAERPIEMVTDEIVAKIEKL